MNEEKREFLQEVLNGNDIARQQWVDMKCRELSHQIDKMAEQIIIRRYSEEVTELANEMRKRIPNEFYTSYHQDEYANPKKF